MFGVVEVDFLGCTVSVDGIKPHESKIKAIKYFPLPSDYASCRKLLGMAGFYRRFVPHFSDLVIPLQDCINSFSVSKKFILSNAGKEAVEHLKEALISTVTLAHSSPKSNRYQLVTDASVTAVGAALNQLIDEEYMPVAFFFKFVQHI